MAAKRKQEQKNGKKPEQHKQASGKQSLEVSASTIKKRNTTNTPLPAWATKLSELLGKRALLGLCLVWVVVSAYVFWDFITLKSVYYFSDIGSDEINATYPIYMVVLRMLAEEGSAHFWSFYIGMGQSLKSVVLIDPLDILLSPIRDFAQSTMGADYYVSGRIFNLLFPRLFLTVLIGYGYFQTYLQNRFVAVIGALAVTFSGYMIMGSAWGHTGVVFIGILLLFAFEQLFMRQVWIWMIYAFFAMSNNPFYMLVLTVFVLTYSVVRMLNERKSFSEALAFYAKTIGLALLGIMLNAANLITPYLTMFRSPRVAGNVSTIGSGGNAEVFHVDNFPEWITVIYRTFSTDLLGNGSNFKGWNNYLEAPAFYVGVFSLILLPQLFYFLKGRKRIVWALFTGIWLLTAFVPYLRHAVQLFVGNYYKGPYNVVLLLSLLVPAAMALTYILKEKKVQLYLLVGTAVAFLILLNVKLTPRLPFATNLEVKLWVNMLLIAYPALLWATTQASMRIYAKILLLALTVFELAAFSGYTVNERKAFSRSEFKANAGGYNDATMDAIAGLKVADSSLFYRCEKEFASGKSEHQSLNDAQAQGYFGTANYASFNQEYYIKFLLAVGVIPPNNETATRWAMGVRGRPLLQSLCGVKYIFTKNEQSEMLRFGYEPFQKNEDVITLKNKYALPLGFCYDSIISRSEFDKLSNFQKDVMLLRAAVVDDNSAVNLPAKNSSDTLTAFSFAYYDRFVSARRADTLQITSFKHADIVGSIELAEPRMLFTSIPFDYGWTVFVDQTETQPTLTHVGFVGVPLAAGKHIVRFQYRPPYFALGKIISYSTAVLILAMLGFSFFVARKRKSIEKDVA